MEILLLVAIMAVAASGLYVAATFNKRTMQTTAPLIDGAVKEIAERHEVIAEDLRRQLQAITKELRQGRELTTRERSEIQGRHDQADSGISSIASQFLAALGTVERLGKQTGTWQGDLSRDLLQLDDRVAQLGESLAQLDHRVAQLGESLAQQSARVIEIHRYPQSREVQAASSAEIDSLVSAVLAAESHMDRKGWGKPPHLYALTAKTTPATAAHEPDPETRDARPDAMILVEREPLPDGDLVEALAGIHWPDDVAGCVLVAELTALPPRSKEDGPIDPAAAEQWASTHPDGRPARLAVGVRRDGAHTCGFRIKGEDNVQVGTERADDLVTALLGTFQGRIEHAGPAPSDQREDIR